MKFPSSKGKLILSRPWVLACVLAVTVLVYLPSLNSGFVNWDDDAHLYENTSVRGLDRGHLEPIFTERVNKTYIPLTVFSYAVEHHFFGLNPFVYHLNNLLLHLAVAALVFVFAGRLGLSVGASGFAALVFAIHPMHVESVAWVTERKDVLYSFFYILALLSYWSYLKTQSKFQMFVTCAWGTLSLLAKPMALSLPLVLFLLDWFAGRKKDFRRIWEKIPLILITTGIVWITYAANARVPGRNFVEAALTWCWTFAFYIRQFIFPGQSVPINRLPQPVSLSNVEYVLPLVIIAVVVWALARFRRHRWFMFAFLYFFLSIFFLLRFDDKVDVTVVADRFMYLPSLGVCLALGIWFERIVTAGPAQNVLLKNFGRACVLLLLLLMGWKSFGQTKVWKDAPTLWAHQIQVVPWEPIAYNNLATILRDEKEYKDAEERFAAAAQSDGTIDQGTLRRLRYIERLYQSAIGYYSKYADPYYNLGNFYHDLGWKERAVPLYLKAMECDKQYRNVYINLRNVYSELGEDKKAIDLADAAVALDPSDGETYQNIILAFNKVLRERPVHVPVYEQARARFLKAYHDLLEKRPAKAADYFTLGYLYTDMGFKERAIDFYKRAVQLNPGFVDAWYNLANLYDETGNSKAAFELYEKVIRLQPRFSQAYLNLGVLKGRMGDNAQAKVLFEKAVQVDRKNADAYFNLGFLAESAGDLAGAAGYYQKTISVDPKHAEGYYNLGNVLAGEGKLAEAAASYEKTVSINKRHTDAWVNILVLALQLKDFSKAAAALEQAQKLGYEAPAEYVAAVDENK